MRTILAVALLLAAGAQGEPADEPWDAEEELRARIARVNTGALAFLATPPARAVHHHHNEVILGPESLADGWARLRQCHEHLDPVPRAEVVFRGGRVRNLRVESSSDIERAWVEGASVQLVGVSAGARLCVEAESQVLTRNDDGGYSVRNGPYMRRFLDGYYPMQVSVEVHYPCDRLRFTGATPSPQPGFVLRESSCRVDLEAWFEGKLNTELRFEALEPPDPS